MVPGRVSLRSASTNTMLLPQTRTKTIGPRGFFYSCPAAWNNLPSALRILDQSLPVFKKNLKTFLFQSWFCYITFCLICILFRLLSIFWQLLWAPPWWTFIRSSVFQMSVYSYNYNSSAIQTLVHAFVCTRVDFSNSLLMGQVYGTSAYLLNRLQSVLNSAARLILTIGKNDPISVAIRRDIHWLPIQYSIQFKLNSITSNCLAGRAPEYLIEFCHSVNDIPARRNGATFGHHPRSSSWFLDNRYRKERSGRRSFSVSTPQLWNLLPANIRLLHNEHLLFRKKT